MGNQIRPFDFTNNQKSNPRQEQTLIAFCNTLALDLAKHLGLAVKSNASPFSWHKAQTDDQSIWGSLFHPRSRQQVFLKIGPEAAAWILSQKLGGGVHDGGRGVKRGSISEKLLQQQLAKMLATLETFTKRFIPGDWHSRVLESWNQEDLSNYFAAHLDFSIEGVKDKTLSLELFCARTLAGHLSDQGSPKSKDFRPTKNGLAMLENLRSSEITLRVILGEKKLSLREICELRSGQILMLDSGKDDLVKVTVENKPIFKARLGMKNKRYQIKLT